MICFANPIRRIYLVIKKTLRADCAHQEVLLRTHCSNDFQTLFSRTALDSQRKNGNGYVRLRAYVNGMIDYRVGGHAVGNGHDIFKRAALFTLRSWRNATFFACMCVRLRLRAHARLCQDLEGPP